MRVSRRGFLAAAGAAPLGGVLSSWPTPAPAKVLGCALEESRAGFERGLATSPDARVLIFPAAIGWDGSLIRRVNEGATVVFESATGFGDAKAFDEQRAGLHADFGFMVEPPSAPSTGASGPVYVDLLWPAVARIRDFSSFVAVRGGRTAARLGPLPVAALQRRGKGAFLFLGSPVGPALWSGDAQAHAWLASLLAAASPYAWTPGASWPVRSTYST